MPKPREDRRVTHTKAVLKKSLLELLLEKPITRITVTDVCRRADINRGTFYAHYVDPEDLLRQIESNMKEALTQALALFGNEEPEYVLPAVCNVLTSDKELCLVLFGDYGDKDFLHELVDMVRDSAIEYWRSVTPELSQSQLELLFTFCANGLAALIRDWARSSSRQVPEELGQMAARLIRACVECIQRNAAL